MEIFLNHC